MVTPIMVANIGWGTYLFFAAVNATFLPILWFFYPETANRSLEEIDIIFAKGFVENISYVKAAKDLPLLSPEEVENYALNYGLIDTASHAAAKQKTEHAHNAVAGSVRDESTEEKSTGNGSNEGVNRV